MEVQKTHSDFKGGHERAGAAKSFIDAGVAEWQGTGLQSRSHGFESRHSL
jgi:hypothetical protein